jgi:hypothetical protein
MDEPIGEVSERDVVGLAKALVPQASDKSISPVRVHQVWKCSVCEPTRKIYASVL